MSEEEICPFGPFKLGGRLLQRQDRNNEMVIIRLRPQVLDLLVYLANHHDRPVLKSDVFNAIRKEKTDEVGYDARLVDRALIDLRKAIGDHFITIPEQGYVRFTLCPPSQFFSPKPSNPRTEIYRRCRFSLTNTRPNNRD